MIKKLLEKITTSDVKVDTKNEKVKVSITLGSRTHGTGERALSITPARARRVAALKGVAAGKLLSTPLTISNQDDNTLQGSWEFSLVTSTSGTEKKQGGKSRRQRKTSAKAEPQASASSTEVEAESAEDEDTPEDESGA